MRIPENSVAAMEWLIKDDSLQSMNKMRIDNDYCCIEDLLWLTVIKMTKAMSWFFLFCYQCLHVLHIGGRCCDAHFVFS